MIKAIETKYKGYRFRSRLEARWAVFFDSLGIKWEYEMEGFEYKYQGETLRYLPDFYFPELKAWVEIKPATPGDLDRKKHLAFVLNEQCNLFVNLVGAPDPAPSFIKDYVGGSIGTALLPTGFKHSQSLVSIDFVNFCYDKFNKRNFFLMVLGNEQWNLTNTKASRELVNCNGTLAAWWGKGKTPFLIFDARDIGHFDSFDFGFSDNVYQACVAARSARFEYGENG